MRILVLSPSLPLPFGQADARWLSVMLRELAARGNEVVCVSCTEEPEARIAEAQHLAQHNGFRFRHTRLELEERLVSRKLRSLARPFSEFRRAANLSGVLEEELGDGVDVFHVEHLFSVWAVRDFSNVVVFLHHLEVIDLQGRPDLDTREKLTRWQSERATTRLLGRPQRLMAATPRLEEAAKHANPRLATEVVPVALDPNLYPPIPVNEEPIVGVIGSMHWYPSRSAAIRVLTSLWPEIRRRLPTARLLVGGWNSSRYLGQLFPIEGAELVPHIREPRDFFERIALLLYPPPIGSGMKIKVLEAMAYGVPVVSNGEGLEGIEFENGVQAIQAETDRELVDQTVDLLEDPSRRRRLGEESRALIEALYSPTPAVDRLLSAYTRLFDRRRA